MQREVSEVEGTTVAGDTIDRILRRDTLAFLAQRGLSEAGPERATGPGACCVRRLRDPVHHHPEGTTFVAEPQP